MIVDEPKCPAKRSPINPTQPPRQCYERCARYEYAVHLSGREWIAPKIKGSECPNYRLKEKP